MSCRCTTDASLQHHEAQSYLVNVTFTYTKLSNRRDLEQFAVYHIGGVKHRSLYLMTQHLVWGRNLVMQYEYRESYQSIVMIIQLHETLEHYLPTKTAWCRALA